MDRIPITFDYKGKQYTGVLSEVAGVGRPNVWYLMIENRYCGRLMHTDRGWVFHSERMPALADFLVDCVIAWYQ